MIDGARSGLAWLAHPITLVALAVLAVNDHLLKPAYPGLVTGKLSDVAGLVVAPALLATVLLLAVRRLPTGGVAVGAIAVVGVGYTFVKASEVGSGLATAAWSAVAGPSLIRADLTDLAALPALALAGYAWTRARHAPVPGRVARLVRVGIVLPVTMLAVAATGPVKVESAENLFRWENSVVLMTLDDAGELQPTAIGDGVTPWRPLTATELNQLAEVSPVPLTLDCAANEPQHCYRVGSGALTIEESTDGGRTWADSYAMSRPEVEEIAREYERRGQGNTRDKLQCSAVMVRSLSTGHVVVAACHLGGFLQRDVGGGWSRLGFPTAADGDWLTDPPPLIPFNAFDANLVLLLGWGVYFIGYEIRARGRGKRFAARRIFGAAPVLATVCFGTVPTFVLAPARDFNVAAATDYPVWEVAFLSSALLVLIAIALQVRVRVRWWPFAVVGLLVAAGVALGRYLTNLAAIEGGMALNWVAGVTLAGMLANLMLAVLLPKPAAERVARPRPVLNRRPWTPMPRSPLEGPGTVARQSSSSPPKSTIE